MFFIGNDFLESCASIRWLILFYQELGYTLLSKAFSAYLIGLWTDTDVIFSWIIAQTHTTSVMHVYFVPTHGLYRLPRCASNVGRKWFVFWGRVRAAADTGEGSQWGRQCYGSAGRKFLVSVTTQAWDTQKFRAWRLRPKWCVWWIAKQIWGMNDLKCRHLSM